MSVHLVVFLFHFNYTSQTKKNKITMLPSYFYVKFIILLYQKLKLVYRTFIKIWIKLHIKSNQIKILLKVVLISQWYMGIHKTLPNEHMPNSWFHIPSPRNKAHYLSKKNVKLNLASCCYFLPIFFPSF